MKEISYVPILKTKRAEFSAITQLASQVKSSIAPIFEIEPVPLDPDTDVPEKTYNSLLDGFGRKLLSSCTDINIIYIDGLLIDERFIDPVDYPPMANAVNQARTAGLHVIPVSSPTRTTSYLNQIDSLIQNEVCLRLTMTDLANPQLVSGYITRLRIPYENIDVVIDLRDTISNGAFESGQSYMLALGLINNLTNLNKFRRVILSAGSFPVDLSEISVGVYSQPRFEWLLWQQLYRSNDLERKIIYSDYGVQHPDYTRLATRFPSVSASVRYTGNDDFWVFRGKSANQYGYDQYGSHSQSIVSHPEYSGQQFSAGDQDIFNYASVYASHIQSPSPNNKFGSPEVWRRIGQNHHITKVVEQLASLYGL
ncbi:beta family protein [Dickeya zeae]|uniref:Beta family protein n=1 Tax=Dickeya zeae TaxID=204042 RepID=A0ABX8VZS4_9GAMM|nr:beta family protein [Dickeya zeae]QYM91249.1 beta family protein [Dickeya zeae]